MGTRNVTATAVAVAVLTAGVAVGVRWHLRERMTVVAMMPGAEARSFLTDYPIRFEEMWPISVEDSSVIGQKIGAFVWQQKGPLRKPLHVSVQERFADYSAECIGIVVRGERQVFCNLVRLFPGLPGREEGRFTEVFDAGAGAIDVILAGNWEVVAFEQRWKDSPMSGSSSGQTVPPRESSGVH
jgi:hypothetical protein